jgi:hypothetical protein
MWAAKPASFHAGCNPRSCDHDESKPSGQERPGPLTTSDLRELRIFVIEEKYSCGMVKATHFEHCVNTLPPDCGVIVYLSVGRGDAHE